MKFLNSTMFTCAQIVIRPRHDSDHGAPRAMASRMMMIADKRDN